MGLFVKYPGSRDLMATVTIYTILAVLFRFLFDGVSFTVLGQTFALGHIDAAVYGAILAPVLAAQGWVHQTNSKKGGEIDEKK